MKCPVDKTPLKVIDREEVKIDYCPTCKGVWLDRGELEKIIERSSSLNTSKEDHPGYPDFTGKSAEEGLGYKGPAGAGSFLGRLFRV